MNNKSTIDNKKEKEDSIVEAWSRICKEYNFSGLTDQEKAQFERAQLAEEQAKKTHFVLGEPIRNSF
jgi:hypothetical protein